MQKKEAYFHPKLKQKRNCCVVFGRRRKQNQYITGCRWSKCNV